MAKQLKNIDGNKLGDHLEDYCNEELNERLRKFMILDSQSSIEDILEKAEFTEITWTDVSAGTVVAEATLVEVNRVLKAHGIDFAFRRFDAIDYQTYMLVNTKENLKATAQRVRSTEFKEQQFFS
jgi:ubiquinone/menaquinone biosynthesis C-methylase UbiE